VGEGGSVLEAGAAVPTELEHDRFVATPLTAATAALDYASYMSSPEVIRVHSDGRWPTDGFTLDDDLELVARHEADHQNRRAFTFVLLAPSRTEALGCVYVNPLREYLRRSGADALLLGAIPSASAMVTFWLRQDQQETGLADVVVHAVNDWFVNEWPLAIHLFRVLPDETSSRTALDHLGLQQMRLAHPADPRPYIWYRPRGTLSERRHSR
jgi:RimJ/RimL family protein N-acetyltransferase